MNNSFDSILSPAIKVSPELSFVTVVGWKPIPLTCFTDEAVSILLVFQETLNIIALWSLKAYLTYAPTSTLPNISNCTPVDCISSNVALGASILTTEGVL